MKKAMAKRWVKALRSGEYEQGQGSLCEDGKFCCLGVLIDTEVDGDWEYDELDSRWAFGGTGGGLTYALNEILGLGAGAESDLIDMNDDRGKSFNEIADEIERLFVTGRRLGG